VSLRGPVDCRLGLPKTCELRVRQPDIMCIKCEDRSPNLSKAHQAQLTLSKPVYLIYSLVCTILALYAHDVGVGVASPVGFPASVVPGRSTVDNAFPVTLLNLCDPDTTLTPLPPPRSYDDSCTTQANGRHNILDRYFWSSHSPLW